MNSSSKAALFQDSHVFDVDPQTGFMPCTVPISRLPSLWEPWEAILDDAVAAKLQVGDKVDLRDEDRAVSAAWRARVRLLPLLSTKELEASAILLRRAHLVLAFVMHFYVQSLPPDAPVVIPRPISLPILRISIILDIPPLLTYSDTVLYNWVIDAGPSSLSTSRPSSPSLIPQQFPTVINIHSKTLFSGLVDEEEFYLCSARIELRGVEALELMRMTMDEIFIGDNTAVRRIAGYLQTMATVINDLKTLLMDVRNGCRPNPYYNDVRPWFRGEDSDENGRKWSFEGIEEDPELTVPKELSGPSAGQSSIVHVLDVFLGVDHQSPHQASSSSSSYHPPAGSTSAPTSPSLPQSSSSAPHPPPLVISHSAPAGSVAARPSFMARMQIYMPHNHRRFLDYLAANSRPLRTFVAASKDAELLEAFNTAVGTLKEFRDAHMIIATLYILSPARRVAKLKAELNAQAKAASATPSVFGGVFGRTLGFRSGAEGKEPEAAPLTPLKGTGGTDLVKFLKDTRNRTSETMLR